MTKKQIMTLSLTTVLTLSITFSVSAASLSQTNNSKANSTKVTSTTDYDYDYDKDGKHNEKPETFETMMKDLDTTKIPSSDLEKLKKLYSQMTELESKETNKNTEADYDNPKYKALWTEFDKILTKYFPNNGKHNEKPETFETMMKDLDTTKIPSSDLAKLKKLYNQMTELESKETNKNTEADYDNPKYKALWTEFDKILTKYFPNNGKHNEKPETFETMMKGLDTTKIPSSELAKLKKLYNQMTELESKETNTTTEADYDNPKYKALWTEFDKILTKYIPKSSLEQNHTGDSYEKDDIEHTAANDSAKTTSGK